MSKSFPSFSKGGIIHPGCIVSGAYGALPSLVATEPWNKRRRIRERIRGVVLRSHSQGHWNVHWFLIGKNAYVPFNKIAVEPNTSPIDESHLEELLRENDQNFIGDSKKLRIYIDNYLSQSKKKASSTTSVTPSPRPNKRQMLTAGGKSTIRMGHIREVYPSRSEN